jgi:hypothetical protein
MATLEADALRTLLSDLKLRAKANYDRDVEAIERVERLLTLDPGALVPTISKELMLLASVAPCANGQSQTAVPESDEQTSLIDSVEAIFRHFPDRSWNVSMLEAQLRQGGFAFAAKNPKASINTSLARLTDRGTVRVTRRGAGRKPSIYKAAANVSDANVAVPES